MSPLEDGSVSGHIKKTVQNVVYGFMVYIHVNQISFQRQYFVSTAKEIRVL
jgi:hypothetical protein